MKHSVLCLILLSALGAACSTKHGAYAKQIHSPQELIGGPKALGTVGDFLLANDQIRVVIQAAGWSRGFGMFGGGIIDADIQRPGAFGTNNGGQGRDNFGEFFPALFLQAFEVEDQGDLPAVSVIKTGEDGGPAIVRCVASGGDFLAMARQLVGLAIPDHGLRYETDFVLYPHSRHVEVIGRLVNESGSDLALPDPAVQTLLTSFGLGNLQMPLGDVALFGGGNKTFAPGATQRAGTSIDPRLQNPKAAGFDLRYAVESSYGIARELPALPGLVVDYLATAGTDVSYGFAVSDSDRNYVWLNKEQYERDAQVTATKHSMLVPFLLSSFTGAYYEVPPEILEAHSTYEYKRYFVVGTGDVASVSDEIYRIRQTPTGTFEGRVVNAITGQSENDAWVHILDEHNRPFTQARVQGNGRFRARLPAGNYFYTVTAPGRYPFIEKIGFALKAGGGVFRHIPLPAAAELSVRVRDERGRLLPAKVSVVARYTSDYDGLDPRDFLFDLSLGEARRATDMSWHSSATDKARQFVEESFYANLGVAKALLRPNDCSKLRCEYDVYISRGPEYDVDVKKGITLRAGERVSLNATLRRVVDTEDYVTADLHVHSGNSVDSAMGLEPRLLSAAAEGLEIVVSTDHNFITDYASTIAGLKLQDWLRGIVGVELSTLEAGHFNGFPLNYDVGTASHFPFVDYCYPAQAEKSNQSAFDWVQCSPDKLFSQLRKLGKYGPEKTIVQVNHPRDTILGYFNQYYLNPYLGVTEEPTDNNYPLSTLLRPSSPTGQYDVDKFSWDFDALEVFNGKRLDMNHAFVVPETVSDEVVARLQDYACADGHPDNGRNAVLLRKGGFPAYPGAVDDWLHFLNDGRKITATGNSDSHSSDDEIGTPRNFVRLPKRDGVPGDRFPQAVSEEEFVDAISHQRVVASNGPLLTMTLKSGGGGQIYEIGDTAHFDAGLGGQEVLVTLRVRRAPWVDVKRMVIYANGVAQTPVITLPDDASEDFTAEVTLTLMNDTVLVAEVYGDKSLFPIVTPNEEQPANVAQLVSGFTSSLASAIPKIDGQESPSIVQYVTPYALTNPIWVDIDGNGEFDAPGNVTLKGPAPGDACLTTTGMIKAARLKPEHALLALPKSPVHYAPGDIRKLFHGLHDH